MSILFNLRVLVVTFIFILIMGNACAHCRNDIIEDTPNSHFIVNNNGMVTHTTTKLMWMRCSLGQTWDGTTCMGSISLMDWPSALSAAKNYKLGNYSDWRLPNINELGSIVERRCTAPAINEFIFPNTEGSVYWASTPEGGDPQRTLAYVIFFSSQIFSSGFIATNPTTNKLAVRLVRDE
ncbi:DUF1566 domain-containing protein [Vibrio sp. V31_P5A7T61]|uniref:Lcl C-terminal domain-containing protein n=1 Tax=unclassified Vibrio TaxID=2614977 RepID=UPI0013734A11|nr:MULTISPECIES: DUF1566 domain-containing protein [unclassified Vibrio]NAW61298.1 DUF1566 domain-containing protein [Vibrio sp. V31_P5A7T61]NAX02542.1 DUF1566 domain-containing protein [Vibrio sp. V34_P3A8T189]NAX64729.1 DUF1566 domain-containing protein [Vibrio sp. V32_P6A28T40]